MLFHQIQDAKAILRSKGVWKQVDLFSRGNRIYAKWGGGFIGLREWEHGTTIPNVSWEEIEGVDYVFDKAPNSLGVMILAGKMRVVA